MSEILSLSYDADVILKSEDFYNNPTGILQETLDFLGVPASALQTGKNEVKQYREPTKKGYQNSQKPPAMAPKLRAQLVEYFGPHNARLYDFLKRDLGWDG